MARADEDSHVGLPLGLVALTWIRLFAPVLEASLPQSPRNEGYNRLGFAKEAFQRLGTVAPQDLRVGMRFSGDTAPFLHEAIKDVANTIARMPAHFITYPNGGHIHPVRRGGRVSRPGDLRLDEAYCASFGEMLVPVDLWRALQRFDARIEPALISEWGRLMKVYASRQGRSASASSARPHPRVVGPSPYHDDSNPLLGARGGVARARRRRVSWPGAASGKNPESPFEKLAQWLICHSPFRADRSAFAGQPFCAQLLSLGPRGFYSIGSASCSHVAQGIRHRIRPQSYSRHEEPRALFNRFIHCNLNLLSSLADIDMLVLYTSVHQSVPKRAVGW